MKKYEILSIEVIKFNDDVITASTEDYGNENAKDDKFEIWGRTF